MGFTVRNEGFSCHYCRAVNPIAPKTCRNHCRQCFCSEHVDAENPGDRASECSGKMIPQKIEQDPKKEWVITHVCEKCGHTSRNKVAEDDNIQELIVIAQKLADQFARGEET